MWSRKARLVAGGAALAFLAAVATAQWFLLGVALALGLQLAYAGFTFRSEIQTSVEREIERDQVQETDTVDVDTRLRNDGNKTLFLELRETLPRQLRVQEGHAFTPTALDPDETSHLSPTLEAPLMGEYEIGPLVARREDPFAFFSEEIQLSPFDALAVLPQAGPSGEAGLSVDEFQSFMGEYPVNRPGDGFDFYGLREYVPGDTYRMINWKASARTDDVMVDQYERTTSTGVAILVDGRAVTDVGPEHQTPFVRSARATLTLLDAMFDERNEPRVVLYGDGLHTIHPAPPDRMRKEVMEALARWEPAGHEPLAWVMEKILPRLEPGSVVVVVSPMLDDPTVPDAVANALALDYGAAVVVPPLPEMPGTPEAERKALATARRRTIKGLRGFGLDIAQSPHLGTLEVPT